MLLDGERPGSLFFRGGIGNFHSLFISLEAGAVNPRNPSVKAGGASVPASRSQETPGNQAAREYARPT